MKNKKELKLRKRIDFDEIIINKLSFKYTKKEILKKLSFKIKRNEKVGIIGSSGSGKTTLINIFLGLLKAKKGSITLFNKSEKKIYNIENLSMSHVPQEVHMFDDTLINNICIPGNDRIDFKILKKVIKQADLTNVIKKFPKGLKTRMGERGSKISGGQKQRIGIARALYHDTDLLILDEITSSLDIESENNIINLISKIRNKTILLITHKKKNLRVCDKVLNLDSLNVK